MVLKFILGFLFLASFGAQAIAEVEKPPRLSRGEEAIHGGPSDPAKASGDTINLMAARDDPTNGPGEPAFFGDFEDAAGAPDWNGWTSADLTESDITHWKVSNYNQADPANHAAWCLSLIHISEPTRPTRASRMPSSA